MTSLQNMIDLLRERVGLTNTQKVTDKELSGYLNTSLDILDKYLAIRYDDYNHQVYTAGIASGTNVVPTPSDMFKLRGVDYWGSVGVSSGTNASGINWIPLKPMQFSERYNGSGLASTATYPFQRSNLQWKLMGDEIQIYPPEISAGQYQIWYTPKYNPLLIPSQTLRPYMDHAGWVEYAISNSCVKIMNKLNLDPQGFMAEAADYKQLVISSASNRNNAGCKKVANTYGSRYNIFSGNGYNWD